MKDNREHIENPPPVRVLAPLRTHRAEQIPVRREGTQNSSVDLLLQA